MIAVLASLLALTVPAETPEITPADVAGAWSGTATHDGESTPIALELTPQDDGRVLVAASVPKLHLARVPLTKAPFQVEGNRIELPPFALTYDAAAGTLRGTLPEALVPVYRIPFTLRRVEKVEVPARPEPSGIAATPLWTFDAGAPLWAGTIVAGGRVYSGARDGKLHALDAETGTERWAFAATGEIRTRPAVVGDDLYFQSDGGRLYKLSASTGEERWRVQVMDKSAERLPFDDPKSRFDRFGADVTVEGDRLYVGTHDGRMLALAARNGAKLWEFAAGDAILAAPAVHGGRLFFGSYDKHVYALEAATGKLLWKRDTQGAVVSTPAIAGDRLVVGNRCYDLLGIDLATGNVAWKRYIWFSWVESSPTVADGVAYVGSSDAAAVFAFDARTGEPRWATDVYGWPWGQPAVTKQRVYAGAASQAGYLANHRGGVFALDRATGKIVWHYLATPAATGAYGFPGSPAVGGGRVYVAGLDGKVLAFAE